MSNSAIEALESFKNIALTFTSNNGAEFTCYKKISQELGADFYFSHLYSLRMRGFNENTNSLCRQYSGKESDIRYLDDFLNLITNNINTKLKKSLVYYYPQKIFMLIN